MITRSSLLLVSICLAVTPFSAIPVSAQSERFPGGAKFGVMTDAMTDRRSCVVATDGKSGPIAIAMESGSAIIAFQSRELNPSGSDAGLVRIDTAPAFTVTVEPGERALVIPIERAREFIEAMYLDKRILVRWRARNVQHTMSVSSGDFDLAYDRAVKECGWPSIATKRPRASVKIATPDIAEHYRTYVERRLDSNWTASTGGRTGRTMLGFTIDETGAIVSATVVESSGSSEFDRRALDALSALNGFDPPPGRSPVVVRAVLGYGPSAP